MSIIFRRRTIKTKCSRVIRHNTLLLLEDYCEFKSKLTPIHFDVWSKDQRQLITKTITSDNNKSNNSVKKNYNLIEENQDKRVVEKMNNTLYCLPNLV